MSSSRKLNEVGNEGGFDVSLKRGVERRKQNKTKPRTQKRKYWLQLHYHSEEEARKAGSNTRIVPPFALSKKKTKRLLQKNTEKLQCKRQDTNTPDNKTQCNKS